MAIARSLNAPSMVSKPPNKRMQRARDPDKGVLWLGHQRVADARR